MPMIIDRLILGAYETNCYVLRSSEEAKDCLVVDPGLDADPLIDFLADRELSPVAIVLTHGHIDHIAGLAVLRKRFPDAKVYIHKLDAGMLAEPYTNLSAMSGGSFTTEPEDVTLEEPDVIDLAGIKLQVLHTPGHTPGGICLYSAQDGVVLVGDTLFAGSIGRTDFPGGSMSQLLKGVKEKLFTLPGGTKAYPGHGPATTIASEKAHNPFFQQDIL
jgi:hydroxyacylglutathione hydrolase